MISRDRRITPSRQVQLGRITLDSSHDRFNFKFNARKNPESKNLFAGNIGASAVL
jgi:hypothetical protein